MNWLSDNPITMTLASILFSALFAIIASTVLIYGFRRYLPGPVNGLVFMFLIIFMFTWAVGSWLVPIGPVSWGVAWLGYLLIAFLITLLLGVLIPPAPPRSRVIAKAELDEEVKNRKTSNALQTTFGILFWILILVLFVLALYRVFN